MRYANAPAPGSLHSVLFRAALLSIVVVFLDSAVFAQSAAQDSAPLLQVVLHTSSGTDSSTLPPATLTIESVSTGDVVFKATVTPGSTTKIKDAPRHVVRAKLELGGMVLEQKCDLSAGNGGTINFSLQPIAIHGTVSRRGKPVSAGIGVRTAGQVLETHSDETGAYALTVYSPAMYPFEVSDGSAPPFQFVERLSESRRFDIDIPANAIKVRVLDDREQPIRDASVNILNHASDPAIGRGWGRAFKTGDDGFAAIPPLYAGSVAIDVRATGYLPPETVSFTLTASDPERTVAIHLRKPETSKVVHVELPDGSPASNANVTLRAGKNTIALTTDATGQLSIPKGFESGIAASRHAASSSVLLRRIEGDTPWRLAPAAETVLTVKAIDAKGQPARAKDLIVWIDGIPATAVELFALGCRPTTDGDGVWTSGAIPRRHLRVAALDYGPDDAPNTAAYEAIATDVPDPWPAVLIVHSAD